LAVASLVQVEARRKGVVEEEGADGVGEEVVVEKVEKESEKEEEVEEGRKCRS
jgi:hypothetical protein